MRRRIDNFALRWHARLDSDWSDRSLPWILAGAAFVLFGGLALARERMVDAGADLALYSQAVWRLSHGYRGTVTLAGVPISHLNGAFVLYPLSVVARLPVASVSQWLLVVQAAALAYGVLPLWRLARRVAFLRVGAATALVVAYILHPATQNLNLADFRPEALAVPALIAMAHRGLSRSVMRYAAAIALVLLCRAELGLVVASFGILLAVTSRRRTGVITAAVGGLWAVGSLVVPWLGSGDNVSVFPGAFAWAGGSPPSVVGHWLAHPLQTAHHLVAERNFALAVFLILPLAFLPLLSLRYAAVALPWLFLLAMADAPETALRTYLAAAALPLLLVATAFGMNRLARPTLDRVSVPPRVVGALMATTIVFFLSSSASSPYREPWTWGGQDEADQARLALAHTLREQPGLAVAATPRLAVLLASRPQLYLFDPHRPVPASIDAIALDAVDLAEQGSAQLLEAPGGFAPAGQPDHGVALFTRIHPPG